MIKKLFKKLFNNPSEISFKQGFELTDLPLVTLYQGDKKFNFLLDTGSNNSVIDSNILDQIEHTICEKKSNVYGMEGNKQEVSVCEIELSHKNVSYKYPYLICNMKNAFDSIKQDTGVNLHGIIGSKFFNEFKYVLDFDELVAYSKI